jgi:hypothetical protein
VFAIYVREAPAFSIKNGVACIEAKSGDETLWWHLPLHEFRAMVELAKYRLYEHDHAGEVVPFDPKPAKRARIKST